jgi:RND family efflux transporter MFP subunit
MKRNRILTAIGLIVLVLAGGAVFLLSKGQNESIVSSAQAQQPAAPLAVQTTVPERRSVSRLIGLPGDVHPWEETTLYAKVPGYLQSISVDKGDKVRTGQVLAVLQAPELQEDRDQAQQAYRSALAAAQGSRAANDRSAAEQRRSLAALEKAKADDAQSPAMVEKARAILRQMQAVLRQAQEQKNQAETALEENRAQIDRAQADLEAARADQHLADLTLERYQGIYDKNPMLIAKQDVDAAESRAKAARSKTAAAQSALQVVQRHIKTIQSQIASAESQIEQAKAQVDSAQEQVSIAQSQQVSVKKQTDMAERDVEIAQKQRAVTQSKAQETQFQASAGRSAWNKQSSVAEYARIRAPFAGVVTKRYVDPGAFIQTASTSQNAAPLVTVANLNFVRLYVNVPELEARFITVGTPVTVLLNGLPETTFKGRVARTAASLDAKTRSLLAEVDLPNRDRKILPGAYAAAKVVLETHPNVISVPTAAVGVEKSGKFVFVIENGRARRVAVTTGFDDGAHTEIVEGLQGGEKVVVIGRDALAPNAAVTTTPWTPPVRK